MGKRRAGAAGTRKGNGVADETRTKYPINETFDDSQDEFFAGKDHILLEDGPATKRPRLQEKYLLEQSDEEVLPFDDDESDGDSELQSDDEEEEALAQDMISGDGDQLDDESSQDWGRSRADYYDADVIETEADAVEEEQEARRLQSKQLESLTEADYGLDEHQWKGEDVQSNTFQPETITERLPELKVDENASPEDRMLLLRNRYPEFEPLAHEFLDLKKQYDDLSATHVDKGLETTSSKLPDKPDSNRKTYHAIQLGCLSAYLASIAMYLVLLTSTANSDRPNRLALPPSELRNHAVMQKLLHARHRWEKFCELKEPESDVLTSQTEGSDVELLSPGQGRSASTTNGAKEPKLTKAERRALESRQLAQAEEELKMQKTEDQLADLEKLIKSKSKQPKSKPAKTPVDRPEDSDLGDEDALTAQEAAEKAQRKRSLRFYTSQIAQKSSKRGAASRQAGGDIDLPYKESAHDRERREKRESKRNAPENNPTTSQTRPDMDTAEALQPGSRAHTSEKPSSTLPRDDPEAYYDSIHRATQSKKASRAGPASIPTNISASADPALTTDGKRPLPYAIAMNKGLAPKRRKEVRNPRVKKKLRYEQKMKKLGSVRQVWKGGEGRGGYGGELTGINVGVVKGRKL